MKTHTRMTILTTSMAAVFCLVVGQAVAAETPTTTPVPTATPTPEASTTPRPGGGKALNEVAKDTRLKGAASGTPIVISNENLPELAEQGAVTSVDKGKGGGAARPVRQPGRVTIQSGEPDHSDERRRYWRSQYEAQVKLIEGLQQEIRQLDQKIPGMWTDFYSRDDPAYRDGVIKPALDAAMARRQQVEEQLAAAQPRLDEIKDQARRDGGEPGWFRGIPTPKPFTPAPSPGVIRD
jgi:hypothetical protein